ncbi:MAG: HAD family hydrolase [Dehalococcoidia bacterium]|nr:HAD family hydrolase [Dehalococcoidia bacterium]
MARLLLFDIDMTLIRTHGAGRGAVNTVLARLSGVEEATAGMRFDGRTDRAIFLEALGRHGLGGADPERAFEAFVADYLAELEKSLEVLGGVVLPGVPALLDALDARGQLLGLATGNMERGARVKLTHFGLWERFAAGGFGDHTPVRAEVVREGIDALARVIGCDPDPSATIVLGDTPLDIEAAHLAGTRCLAVATGAFDVDALRAAGADWVFADLSDTTRVLDVLSS